MGEREWREFLSADDLEGWVVLHGGPTAVFTTNSLSEAAALAAALAELPDLDSGAVLTLSAHHLTVKLTREVFDIEGRHRDMARAISRIADEHGAVPDPSAVQESQVAVAALPSEIDLGFWQSVLGYVPMAEDNCVDPLGQGSTVWMQGLDPEKPLRHAMHIDVSVGRAHAQKRVADAVAAGGVVVDDSQAPEYWILADRSGNKACVVAWPDGATSPSDA